MDYDRKDLAEHLEENKEYYKLFGIETVKELEDYLAEPTDSQINSLERW